MYKLPECGCYVDEYSHELVMCFYHLDLEREMACRICEDAGCRGECVADEAAATEGIPIERP